VEAFDGPLALLLSLIEQRQLDVLSVPLGDLTAAYLDALATLPGDRLRNISSFIAVASQLILIKSRALLPRPPVPPIVIADAEDPEQALRDRLLLYRRYRDAAARLGERLATGGSLFHREAGTAQAAARAGARPPAEPPLDPRLLGDSLVRSVAFMPSPELPPTIMPRTVTMADRAAVIRASLARAHQLVLQDLLRGESDRVVIAVTFLAMLELVKTRELVVEQHQPWGPIRCRATTTEERHHGSLADPASTTIGMAPEEERADAATELLERPESGP
jgi:segregation and condensation protein A